jgi:hypothetical protein
LIDDNSNIPPDGPLDTPVGPLVIPPEAPLAAAAAPVYLTPTETSEQKRSEVPESSLPDPTGFQSFYHAHWQPMRRRIFAAMERTAQPEHRTRAFAECCLRARPEFKGPDEINATEWRIVTDRCHDRLCEVCAAARAWDIRLALYDQLKDHAHKFITLTLRSSPNELLTDCIDRLEAGFKALRRLKLWTDAVRGGCAFLEITRGKEQKRWHVHFHIIADSTFIGKAELSNAWRACTTDSYIVDIQAAGGKTAANYVTKYVTKAMPAGLLARAAELDEFVSSIKGRRLCLTFGDWYGKATLAALESESDLLPSDYGWQPAQTYSVAGLLAFLPATPAAAALADIAVIRWLRGQHRATSPPVP